MTQQTDKSFAQLRVEAEALGIVTKDNATQGKAELKEAIAKRCCKQIAAKETNTNRGGGR